MYESDIDMLGLFCFPVVKNALFLRATEGSFGIVQDWKPVCQALLLNIIPGE